MKTLRDIFIILIFHVSSAYGQDICKTNINEEYINSITKGTIIDRPFVSDSIQFELRFWICNYFLPDRMIQITKKINGLWDYNLGFLKYEKKKKYFIFQDSLKTQKDWNCFHSKLDSFLKADLPDQVKIDLTFEENGITKKLRNEDFFSGIYEGVFYTLEFFDNENHVTISYHVPEFYLDRLKKLGLPTKEHEAYINFIHYLIDTFNYNKLEQIQRKEYLVKKNIKIGS